MSDERLSFGSAVDKAVVYLMAGLIAFLCVNSIALREQMVVLVERTATDRKIQESMQADIKALHAQDLAHDEQIRELRETDLRHGWK